MIGSLLPANYLTEVIKNEYSKIQVTEDKKKKKAKNENNVSKTWMGLRTRYDLLTDWLTDWLTQIMSNSQETYSIYTQKIKATTQTMAKILKIYKFNTL